jgi:asparagine synthase (glutamine-hydrolysing)
MCGIVGALSFRDSAFAVTPPYVARMRAAVAHRGPDGEGLWVDAGGRIGLGHQRLSIIDLSLAAAQPMSNADGTLRIVFNGEIYNHADIRTELMALGRTQWMTDHSDTEVILQAFDQWGIECLSRFTGMFAFGLWDARSRQLWLVRDRVGIKPLYHTTHHGRLMFASEIKALLLDPEQSREVDEEALFHFLSFLTTPSPQTLFAGIRKLAPGTWMRVDEDGRTATRRYWDVWDHVVPLTDESEDAIAERVREALRASVSLRKVSDVPVGVFLSGGIDSSTNAVLFSEGETRPVQTFSVGYTGHYGTYQNELGYAREVAQLVGADHHEILLTPDDVLRFLPEMVYLQDEPIADPVCVPVHYVAKLARQHGVVVSQVGEGADELFIGYPSWLAALGSQQYDDLPVPSAVKRLALGAASALGYDRTFHYEWLRRGALGQPLFWGGAEAFTHVEKVSLLSSNVARSLRGLTSWGVLEPLRARFEDAAWERSHLNWMSYVDLNLRLPELLLMRVDKMTMGVALEGRVPFLDHHVVALALSIPSALKVKNGTLKYILKKAVRGLIPDRIIDRPKQGFGVPVDEMLTGGFRAYAAGEVEQFARRSGLLDPAEASRVAATAQGTKLWYLLNLALWWRRFIANEPIAPAVAA